MTAIFPLLAGQDISFTKKPTFSTIVAPHVSGREVRDALYQSPIWRFEVSFNALNSALGNTYGAAVGSQSLQALMGLFLQCQGQYGTFVFYDPTDCAVSSQGFGTGDGATTTFQLLRTLGGFSEPVASAWVASAPAVFPAQGVSGYAPMNVFANSVNLSSGFNLSGAVILTGGQTDPNGGTLGLLMAETATTATHYARQSSIPVVAGSAVTFSCDLLRGGARYVALFLDNGSANGSGAIFDLLAGAVTATVNNGVATGLVTTITPASGSWFRCAVSCVLDQTSTTARVSVVGCNNTASPLTWYPSYLGSTSNTVTTAFAQVEINPSPGAPGPFTPTIATRCYGSPRITAAGALVDPTGYTLSGGAVTFSTPPANGAALQWTGYFGFLCRFDDDAVEFEQFMSQLWAAKSVKFRSVRASS